MPCASALCRWFERFSLGALQSESSLSEFYRFCFFNNFEIICRVFSQNGTTFILRTRVHEKRIIFAKADEGPIYRGKRWIEKAFDRIPFDSDRDRIDHWSRYFCGGMHLLDFKNRSKFFRLKNIIGLFLLSLGMNCLIRVILYAVR